jgi:hypothetical protein
MWGLLQLLTVLLEGAPTAAAQHLLEYRRHTGMKWIEDCLARFGLKVSVCSNSQASGGNDGAVGRVRAMRSAANINMVLWNSMNQHLRQIWCAT